ncbi:MAG: DNA polymerase I, partial [Propionibacteriaceae bacterium]|nr:DNA polymerase I [Propionibacteriaceae bacterium]
TPKRYPELAALVGETSDNLPGVPGVGPKTAAKWLDSYDGLENLLNHAAEVPGKVGESLRAHISDVIRNRELNALVRDMELGVTFSQLERKPVDAQAVHQIFDALEFRTLRERLFAALPVDETELSSGFEIEFACISADELDDWLSRHANASVGMEVIGGWKSGAGDVQSMALANPDGAACWFDVSELTPVAERSLGKWLSDPTKTKALHDAKPAMLAAAERGWELDGIISDTKLAAYLLRPDQRGYELNDLTQTFLKQKLSVGEKTDTSPEQAAFSFDDDTLSADAMLRARAVIELVPVLEAELESQGGSNLLHEVELPLSRVLAQMEHTGIAVKSEVLESLHSDFDSEVKQAQTQAFSTLGHTVNLSSPKQLQTVLFDELGMPKTRRTQTGYTTDAEALEGLFAQTEHPFLAALLRYRDYIKLRQNVEGLLKSIAADGRIHTTYLQTIAATGRLSSVEPNLQNIPIRTEEGRRIREAFVAGAGFETLFTADYSQIEMRIMAHVSNDAGLIEAFGSGEDFHTMMASRVFNVAADAVSAAQRAKIKAMNYGLAYGLSAYGLSQQLKIEQSEAKGLMDEYFQRFGHVRDYLQEIVARARRSGYTETLLGRRRYLPDLNSSNRQRREMAERAALNAPIQGSAADIIKVAMLDVADQLASENMHSRLLLQVHDELVFEVAPGEAERLEVLVRDKMGNAADLAVDLEVSLGWGKSWNEAGH